MSEEDNSKMMDSVTRCLAESTVHGLSNLVLRPSRMMRSLWTILFLASLIGFISHSTLLIMKYLDEAVSSSFIPHAIPFEQPDILICPKRLFALEYVRHPPPDEFEFIKKVSEEFLDLAGRFHLLNITQDRQAFFNNMEFSRIFKAFSYRQSQLFMKMICSDLNNITHFDNYTLNPEFNWKNYICYRITPAICRLQYPSSKLAIHFYIHNYMVDKKSRIPHLIHHLEEIDIRLFGGIDIFFLNRNENLQMNSERVMLWGGTKNRIRIKSIQYNFRNRNKFKCVPNDSLVAFRDQFSIQGLGSLDLFTNSSMCFLNEYCRDYFNNNNCADFHCPIPLDSSSYTKLCYNISVRSNQAVLAKDLAQSSSIWAGPNTFLDCQLRQPCSYSIFQAIVNAEPFHLDTFIKSFFSRVLLLATAKNPGIEEFFSHYEGNNKNMNVWRENFIQVCVSFYFYSFIKWYGYPLKWVEIS